MTVYVPSPPDDGGNLWTYKAPFNLALAATLAFPVEKWGTWSSPDDPGVWQSATAQRNLNLSSAPPPAPPQLLLNLPHWPPQVPDDAAVWSGAPSVLNFKLLLPRPVSVPNYKFASIWDDYAVWSGTPTNVNVKLLLPPPVAVPEWHRWEHYDDASVWQWKAPYNQPLVSVLVYAIPGSSSEELDDPAVWVGKPTPLNFGLLLSKPVSIPARWNWTPDDCSVWSGGPTPLNFGLLLPKPAAVPYRWQQSDDAAFWNASPVPPNNNLLHPPSVGTLPLTTFVNPRYNAIDDNAVWQWQAPYNINIAASLSFPVQKWGTWSSPDDAAFWVGSPRLSVNFALNPPATKTLPLTTFVTPRYNAADDYATWQYQPPYNLTLIASLQFLFPGFGVSYLDDPAVWSGTPTTINLGLNPPAAGNLPKIFPHFPPLLDDPGTWQYRTPFNLSLAASLSFPVQKWGTWSSPDDQAAWQYQPQFNVSLNPPSTGKPKILPHFPPFLDDPAAWSGGPSATNIKLLLPEPVATAQRFAFGYDDAPAWHGRPGPTNVKLLLPAPVSVPYRWQYGDDAAFWLGTPTATNIKLLLPHPVAIAQPFRFGNDDHGNWQWVAPYNVVLANPQAPQKPRVPTVFAFGNDDPLPWQWRQPANFGLYPPVIVVVPRRMISIISLSFGLGVNEMNPLS